MIPGRGHFLITNSTPATGFASSAASGYAAGASTVGAGDGQYQSDIPDGAGIAVFKSNTIFNASTLLDAVGFAPSGGGTPDALYRKGTGLVPAGGVGAFAEYSFARKQSAGLPQSTASNAADFCWSPRIGLLLETEQFWAHPGPRN